MEKIHVIGNQLSYNIYHHPCLVFNSDLLEKGLEIKFFSDLQSPGIENCDVLIFYDDNYRALLPIENKERGYAIEYLEKFFRRFPKVIWFDCNDGSGWLRSYIFPFVDLYTKDQLMKDVNYYQKQHPVGVAHRDYVVENFGIPDSKKSKGPLSAEDTMKLRVSWNRTFRNWKFWNKPLINNFLGLIYKKGYYFSFTQPDLAKRSKIIPYRMNYWPKHPTIKWWREQTYEKLSYVVAKTKTHKLNPPERIRKKKFYQEMKNAVVTISPFGLGEICYRDFEAFIHGSLLFKPSMNHVKTFPDLYKDGLTYIAHAWDFSDFEDKLEEILTHPEYYEEIASEGQKRFRKALSDGAGFAEHFKAMILN